MFLFVKKCHEEHTDLRQENYLAIAALKKNKTKQNHKTPVTEYGLARKKISKTSTVYGLHSTASFGT